MIDTDERYRYASPASNLGNIWLFAISIRDARINFRHTLRVSFDFLCEVRGYISWRRHFTFDIDAGDNSGGNVEWKIRVGDNGVEDPS